MDPINTAVTAVISSLLKPLVDSTIELGKDALVKRWPRWNAVIDDLSIYADECEKEIAKWADRIQSVFLECFESGSPESQQAKRVMSAGRGLLKIPGKGQKLDTEWEKSALLHYAAPALENPLFLELKKTMETKMGSFVTAYRDEMMNYAKGLKVSREVLLLEKESAMEIWHYWMNIVKQLVSQMTDIQAKTNRDLRVPEIPVPTLTPNQVQVILQVQDGAVSAIDELFMKMINRISMAD